MPPRFQDRVRLLRRNATSAAQATEAKDPTMSAQGESVSHKTISSQTLGNEWPILSRIVALPPYGPVRKNEPMKGLASNKTRKRLRSLRGQRFGPLLSRPSWPSDSWNIPFSRGYAKNPMTRAAGPGCLASCRTSLMAASVPRAANGSTGERRPAYRWALAPKCLVGTTYRSSPIITNVFTQEKSIFTCRLRSKNLAPPRCACVVSVVRNIMIL